MAEMLLEIEHLYKSYDNNPPVLKDISFQIQKGEVIVILGPSGCGKSTLLRCLNGLEVFQAGNIKLDGESITRSKKDWPQIRQKIGMVFQSYDLFAHMTVMENILLGPIKVQKRNKEEASLQAEKLLERVGLSDKKMRILVNFQEDRNKG